MLLLIHCVTLFCRRRSDLILRSGATASILSIDADYTIFGGVFWVIQEAKPFLPSFLHELFRAAFKKRLDSLFLLFLLLYSDVFDRSIDLCEERVVCSDTASVPRREYMLVVVGELLPAYCTDDVTRTRFGFFEVLWPLLGRSKFLRLLCQVFEVLFVEEALVLLCELTLFLQLKDASAQRSSNVEMRDIVLSDVNAGPQIHLERLLLRYSIHRKGMAFVSVLVFVLLASNRGHMRG